jgi:hypothetical protein
MYITCRCGHTIKDQSDNLPHKAQILPDQAMDGYYSPLWEDLESFLAALLAGEGRQWQEKTFGEAYAALNLRPYQVVSDIYSRNSAPHCRAAYVCVSCGRVYLGDPKDDIHFVSYLPEFDPRPDILASITADGK